MVRPPVTSLAIHSWKEHGRPRPWQDPNSDREDATFHSHRHHLHEHQRNHSSIAPRLAVEMRDIPRSWSTDEGLAAQRLGDEQSERTPLAGAPGTLRAAERALQRSTSHDSQLVLVRPGRDADHLDRETSNPTRHPSTEPKDEATLGLNALLDFFDGDESTGDTDGDEGDGTLSDCHRMLVHTAAPGSEQAVQVSFIKSVLSDDNLRRNLNKPPPTPALGVEMRSAFQSRLLHHRVATQPQASVYRPPGFPRKSSGTAERQTRRRRHPNYSRSVLRAAHPEESTESESESDPTTPEHNIIPADRPRTSFVSCAELASTTTGRFYERTSPLAGPSREAPTSL